MKTDFKVSLCALSHAFFTGLTPPYSFPIFLARSTAKEIYALRLMEHACYLLLETE